MSSIISVVQSYSNTIQQYDAQSSINSNNQDRINAIKSLDMNAISEAGPSDPTVSALAQSDKKKVIQNADNSLKQKCLEVWGESLDNQVKKEFAEDFNVFGD